MSRRIVKDRTTIAKEVKKNAVEKKIGTPGYPFNACLHRKICRKKSICEVTVQENQLTIVGCAFIAIPTCSDFKEESCTGLLKPSYVCNGCLELDKCILRKDLSGA